MDNISEVEVFNSDDYILVEQICEALEDAKIKYIKNTNSFSVANALQIQTGFNTNSYSIIVSNENENKAKEIIENITKVYIAENYTEELPEELREYEEDKETEEIEEEPIFSNKHNLKSIDDCIKVVNKKYKVLLILLLILFMTSIVYYLFRINSISLLSNINNSINWIGLADIFSFVFLFTFIIYFIAYKNRLNKINKTIDELSNNNMLKDINDEIKKLKYLVNDIVITNKYIIDFSYTLIIIDLNSIAEVKTIHKGVSNGGSLAIRGLHIICNDGKEYNIESMYSVFIYNVIQGKENPEEGLYTKNPNKLFLKTMLYTFLFFAIYTILMYIYISCQD